MNTIPPVIVLKVDTSIFNFHQFSMVVYYAKNS
jgi:hypothetical protein